jgi:hypothetical protein
MGNPTAALLELCCIGHHCLLLAVQGWRNQEAARPFGPCPLRLANRQGAGVYMWHRPNPSDSHRERRRRLPALLLHFTVLSHRPRQPCSPAKRGTTPHTHSRRPWFMVLHQAPTQGNPTAAAAIVAERPRAPCARAETLSFLRTAGQGNPVSGWPVNQPLLAAALHRSLSLSLFSRPHRSSPACARTAQTQQPPPAARL